MTILYPQPVQCDSANPIEIIEDIKPADWGLDELNQRAGALVKEALAKWPPQAFSYSDAIAYWCVIRQTNPNRIVEIGSGFSTLIAGQAVQANGQGTLTCIEPYPKPWLRNAHPQLTLIEEPIQQITPERLNELLSPGDLLFIDSTHTVKAGSDCLWIYLHLLPRLTADVTVHVHDVFLPFPPPKRNALERNVYWLEQYLLMAYLLDNPRTSVIFGSNGAARILPAQADRLMGGKARAGGGSIWFSQRARAGATSRWRAFRHKVLGR